MHGWYPHHYSREAWLAPNSWLKITILLLMSNGTFPLLLFCTLGHGMVLFIKEHNVQVMASFDANPWFSPGTTVTAIPDDRQDGHNKPSICRDNCFTLTKHHYLSIHAGHELCADWSWSLRPEEEISLRDGTRTGVSTTGVGTDICLALDLHLREASRWINRGVFFGWTIVQIYVILYKNYLQKYIQAIFTKICIKSDIRIA